LHSRSEPAVDNAKAAPADLLIRRRPINRCCFSQCPRDSLCKSKKFLALCNQLTQAGASGDLITGLTPIRITGIMTYIEYENY